MALSKADKACAEVINGLKLSGLTWGVQETPYSAYVTIRKKFQKGVEDNNLAASMNQSKRADEDETLRRDLEKLNSDYNALKACYDTEKAVTHSQDAAYKTLSSKHDSLINKFEDLKLDYAAEVDNSENLAKSLQLVNQELEQKRNVIKSIPPDYLDALERLRSEKPCCRDRSKREEDLEIKLKCALPKTNYHCLSTIWLISAGRTITKSRDLLRKTRKYGLSLTSKTSSKKKIS